MAKTIWKYEIPMQDAFTIDLPEHAQVIHVDVQKNVPCMWALVDTSEAVRARPFRLFGTGQRVPEAIGAHLGTFLLRDSLLVFHLFYAYP